MFQNIPDDMLVMLEDTYEGKVLAIGIHSGYYGLTVAINVYKSQEPSQESSMVIQNGIGAN